MGNLGGGSEGRHETREENGSTGFDENPLVSGLSVLMSNKGCNNKSWERRFLIVVFYTSAGEEYWGKLLHRE